MHVRENLAERSFNKWGFIFQTEQEVWRQVVAGVDSVVFVMSGTSPWWNTLNRASDKCKRYCKWSAILDIGLLPRSEREKKES